MTDRSMLAGFKRGYFGLPETLPEAASSLGPGPHMRGVGLWEILCLPIGQAEKGLLFYRYRFGSVTAGRAEVVFVTEPSGGETQDVLPGPEIESLHRISTETGCAPQTAIEVRITFRDHRQKILSAFLFGRGQCLRYVLHVNLPLFFLENRHPFCEDRKSGGLVLR
jgi:hypothetical protein